jgi:putative MATE family efflux protein
MALKKEIDMCSGPLAPKILRFAVPLILTGLLQMTFSAVDMAVVGQFTGSDALAAVGATTNLSALLVMIFMGLSTGVNVLVARFFGAKDRDGIQRTVHTAILASILGGICFGLSGQLLTEPLLRAMDTPENIIGMSVTFMRLNFLSLPFIAVYDFGGAILRAVGNTRSPLIFLIISGIANVLLCLLFVIVFQMGVAGVGTASLISQGISAALVVRLLMKTGGLYKLTPRRLRIDKRILAMMVRIGVPDGLQSTLFNMTNVIIQSSINSFGTALMAGNAASINIESFIFAGMNAFSQAAIAFTGQNMGAGKHQNINRIYFMCCGMLMVGSGSLCALAIAFRYRLIGLYVSEPDVIVIGAQRLVVISLTYVLLGFINITAGVMRGMGYSLLPTLVSLVGICGLRIVWIYTVFPVRHTFMTLLLSYPISWAATLAVIAACLFAVKRRVVSSLQATITT